MTIETNISKYKNFESSILEIIDKQNIPNITRIVLHESGYRNLIMIIFTKNNLSPKFREEKAKIIANELKSYLNIDLFLTLIEKDPTNIK
jgi:hypothetical protein